MKRISFFIFTLFIAFTSCQEKDQELEELTKDLKKTAQADSASLAVKEIEKQMRTAESPGEAGMKSNVNSESRASTLESNFYVFARGKTDKYLYKNYSVNGVDWSGNKRVSGSGSFQSDYSPKPVFFKDKMFLFYADEVSTDRIKMAYSYDGNYWYEKTLPGATNKKMGACVHNGKIYIFFKGNTNNNLNMAYSSDGFNWTYKAIDLPDAQLQGGPDAVSFGGHIYISYLKKWSWINDGVGEPWIIRTKDFVNYDAYDVNAISAYKLDVSEYSNLSLSVFKNMLYMFAHTEGDKLQYTRSKDGIVWRETKEIAISDFNPASTVIDNKLYLFYRRKSSDWVNYNYSSDGVSWSSTRQLEYSNSSLADPSAASSMLGDQPSEQQNVTLPFNATATASSTYSGYSAANVVDGSRNTYTHPSHSWANQAALPEWVKIDLGSKRTFSRIELYTSFGYEIQDYTIQYSPDGSLWYSLVSQQSNSKVHNSHIFSSKTARFIRVIAYKGPSKQPYYGRLNEVEVYEK